MSLRPDLVACWLFRSGAAGELEILLIRRAPDRLYPGLWQCVTGKLEAGETIAAAALREVAEEVGFRAAAIEAFYETDTVNFFHEGSLDTVLCEAVFAARVSPGAEVRLSPEHDDARWLSIAAAKALVTWPAYERAIDQVAWLVEHPAKAEAFRRLLRLRIVIDQRSGEALSETREERLPALQSKVDRLRPTYGFEDVSLAPGIETIEPNDVELGLTFCGIELRIPVLGSAMDAVVDPAFAGVLAGLGGLAVLNLEGVQTRYDEPGDVLRRISGAPDDEVQHLLAEAYGTPIRDDLVARRIEELHAAGSKAAVAATPAAARRWGPFCAEHGADLFLVQSQVSSARHLATGYDPLSLADFTRFMPIPVAVGNTTNAEAAFRLMEQGAAAVFVGVGPGAACTTREVLGIGIPQVTAIADVAGARDAYLERTGRYVPVVADGGMRRGGELAKAIAAGADVVMLGSPLARAAEAPGGGVNWGMAAPSPVLPRGTRIKVGTAGSLEQILFGPATVSDGSQNLMGALRQSMAALGARTIAEMQQAELVYAPSVATEGKSWQQRGR